MILLNKLILVCTVLCETFKRIDSFPVSSEKKTFELPKKESIVFLLVNYMDFFLSCLVLCASSVRQASEEAVLSVFTVCYSDKHFVNSSHGNPHFILGQKEESVRNFRAVTIVIFVLTFVCVELCFICDLPK